MKWKKVIEHKTGMKEIIIQIEDDGDTQDIAVLRLFVDEKQADSIIDILNDHPTLLSQKAALLAACKGWQRHMIQTFRELPIPEKERELMCLTQSAIEQAGESGE